MSLKMIHGPLLHEFELLGKILKKSGNDRGRENGENCHYNSQRLSSIMRPKRVQCTYEVEPFPMAQAMRRAMMSIFASHSAIK
jgi:hypothetical protein